MGIEFAPAPSTGLAKEPRRAARKFEENHRAPAALFFFLVAVIAGLLGFTGISAAAAGIAKILFFVFVVLFVLALLLGFTLFRAIP